MRQFSITFPILLVFLVLNIFSADSVKSPRSQATSSGEISPKFQKTSNAQQMDHNDDRDEDDADLLRILIIVPATKLKHTHFELHQKFGQILAGDKRNVEMVLLLGLTESLEKVDNTHVQDPIFKQKLLIWKRNRCGKAEPRECGVRPMDMAKPFENLWQPPRPDYGPKMGDDAVANRYYIDFMVHNEDLYKDLAQYNFNVGIIEATGVERFPLAVFDPLLTIKKTIATSSVPPTIFHWKLMGFENIVNEIPGNNIGELGDHKKAGNGHKEFQLTNQRYIDGFTRVGRKTHTALVEMLSKNSEWAKIGHSLPNFEEHFQRASLFFVNSQLELDYEFVEKTVRERPGESAPKLRFFGGIGLPSDAELNREQLEEETKAIFNHGKPVVLVSFGSVVELGVVHDGGNSQADKDAHENGQLLLEVFRHFPGVNFIFRYGPKTELKAKEKYKQLTDTKNVFGKGWLEQKAILRGSGQTKLHAFISHCGLNSVIEAVKFGIPMICFPFFGDQINNSEALASRDLAKVVDIHAHEGEKKSEFIKALKEILDGTKYQDKLKKLSGQFNEIKPVEMVHREFEKLRAEIGHELMAEKEGGGQMAAHRNLHPVGNKEGKGRA